MSLIQVGPGRFMDEKLAAAAGLKPYTPPAKAPAKAAPGSTRPAAAAPAPVAPVVRTILDVPAVIRRQIEAAERKRVLEGLFDVARGCNVPHEFVDRLVRHS